MSTRDQVTAFMCARHPGATEVQIAALVTAWLEEAGTDADTYAPLPVMLGILADRIERAAPELVAAISKAPVAPVEPDGPKLVSKMTALEVRDHVAALLGRPASSILPSQLANYTRELIAMENNESKHATVKPVTTSQRIVGGLDTSSAEWNALPPQERIRRARAEASKAST